MSRPRSFIIVPLLLMMMRDICVLSISPQEQHNLQPVPTTPLPSEQPNAGHENQTRVMNSYSFIVAGMTQPQSNFRGPSLQNTLQDVPEQVTQIDAKLVSTKDNQDSPQVKTLNHLCKLCQNNGKIIPSIHHLSAGTRIPRCQRN